MKGNIQQYGVKYYAPQVRKLEKSNLKQYTNRVKISSSDAPEASSSNCAIEGREEQEEEGVQVKNGEKKKVLAHVKADDKEFLKQIKEDKKLVKELKKPKKK